MRSVHYIMVFGHGRTAPLMDAQLRKELDMALRLRSGRLTNQQASTKLLLSGGRVRPDQTATDAAAMARYCYLMGVPGSATVLDAESIDLLTGAYNAARLLEVRDDIDRISVISGAEAAAHIRPTLQWLFGVQAPITFYSTPPTNPPPEVSPAQRRPPIELMAGIPSGQLDAIGERLAEWYARPTTKASGDRPVAPAQ